MYINRNGIQFSSSDTADNSSLALIISAWLRSFKRDNQNNPFQGCPVSYVSSCVSGCPSDQDIELGRKAFFEDIDKMIWAFEAEDLPDDCWLVEPPKDKPFEGELDYDKINKHKGRIYEGLDLFSKRFHNLWV